MKERKLVESCIAGDGRAWREFLKAYGAPVYGAISGLLRKFGLYEPETAEDIFASVVEKLLDDDCRALRGFGWNAKFTTYLISIARNKTYDYLRAAGRRPTVSLDAPYEGQEEDLTRTLATHEDLDHDLEIGLTVEEILRGLPTQERLILQLYYFEGMKEREIGQLLGVSVDAVSARKSRALKKLKQKVRKDGT